MSLKKYPATEFAEITPASDSRDYVVDSQSLHSIAMSNAAQRFEFNVKSAKELLPKIRGIWTFLSARSTNQKFTIQLPIYDTPNGVVTGPVSVKQNYNAGSESIDLNNFNAAAGDFIQFAGHVKLYAVESAVGTVATIYPRLTKSVSANESVTVNNLEFTVRRRGQMQKLETDKGRYGQVSFTVYEAF